MFGSFAQVRVEERRAVLGGFFTLLGIMCGHALMETARDALFLASIPSRQLPWVYLGVAVIALAATFLQARVRAGNKAMLVGTLAVSSALTLGFWLVVGRWGSWILYALYVWSGVFSTLVVIRFWTLASEVFDRERDAKRVFAVIGAGSGVGAIAGTSLARAIASMADAQVMLLAAGLLFGACSIATIVLLRSAEEPAESETTEPAPPASWVETLRTVLVRPYLRRMLALLLVATVALTLVDFLFKSAVVDAKPAAELSAFFSTVYLGLNLLSLLVQITLAGWLLRTRGVHQILSILPASFLTLATLLLVASLFEPFLLLLLAVLLKLVDGGMRYSIHRTASEMLFVPLTRDVRSRVKGLIDVMGQRGGQALASLLLLAVVAVTQQTAVVAVLLVLLCGLWIGLAYALREPYLDVFRNQLREGRFETRLEFPSLDLASLETLISKLNSTDDGEVLASLDLLVQQRRAHLIPVLILYHPSANVVIRALDIFTQTRNVEALPIAERLIESQDPAVRAATLRARSTISPDVASQLQDFLDDEAPEVRATALVGLVAADWMDAGQAARALTSFARGATDEEKIALARAIQLQASDRFVSVLIQMADSPNGDVLSEIARAMSAIRSPLFIPSLFDMLAHHFVRPQARAALLELGDDALAALQSYLADPGAPARIRRHIPRTVHLFEPQRASSILLSHLLDDPDGMVRYKILRALGSLRNRHPDLRLDTRVLRTALHDTLAGACRILDWRLRWQANATAGPQHGPDVRELMLDTLQTKEKQAIERIFRLLQLLDPHEDFERIYQGLTSQRRKVRVSSLDLLAAVVEPPLRDPLVSFLDNDLTDAQRLSAASEFYRSDIEGHDDLLVRLLHQSGTAMRCLAAYHIGQNKLHRLAEHLRMLENDSSQYLREVAARALGLLSEPNQRGATT